MTDVSVDHGARERAPKPEDASSPPSTRELAADADFCAQLAAEMQLKTSTVRTALIGESKVRAVKVTEWVMQNEPDDPERRARLLLWWAKRKKAGAFRQDDGDESIATIRDRFSGEETRAKALAEALAAMWTENPESLANAIQALEKSRNGAA